MNIVSKYCKNKMLIIFAILRPPLSIVQEITFLPPKKSVNLPGTVSLVPF
jgi:hypothetical protein